MVVICCCVQLTDEMLELASDKRDEAMAALADGWFQALTATCCQNALSPCYHSATVYEMDCG